MKKIKFLDIPIDAISMSDTLRQIELAIQFKKQIHHTVVNAGKIVLMQQDKALKDSVLNADIINADGQAVVWASKLLGFRIPERVAGIDLMQNLVKLSYLNNYKCFFLGARQEIILKVIKNYTQSFNSNIIAGFRNGYFNENDELQIAKDISESGANILFVAISSPKKEIFLNKYKHHLSSVNFIMGVGGSFDVVAGKVKRAPKWMQNFGLEWFYRFYQEPTRMWRRYLIGNVKFIWLVIKAYFTRK